MDAGATGLQLQGDCFRACGFRCLPGVQSDHTWGFWITILPYCFSRPSELSRGTPGKNGAISPLPRNQLYWLHKIRGVTGLMQPFPWLLKSGLMSESS